MAECWMFAQLQHQRFGVTGYPLLMPELEGKVRPEKLPVITWMAGNQRMLVKAYALADGRCPVKGCEPHHVDYHTRLVATYIGQDVHHRNDQGEHCMTDVGVKPGTFAKMAVSGLDVCPDHIGNHWLAFHIHQG